MILSMSLLAGAAAGLYLISLVYSFYRNIKTCEASGIPYVVLPFQPHSAIAQILHQIWRPLLRYLPASMKGPWIAFMNVDIHWNELYAPFRKFGSDTVLACSPGSILLHSADAEVISRISERKFDFPKPSHIYHIIDIYGKSVISSEGQLWRKHRKITSIPFTEKNNHIVFEEAIFQTGEMLSHLLTANESSSSTIEDVENLTSRVALAIISRAGYGVRIAWPGRDASSPQSSDGVEIPGLDKNWVEGKTGGHTMSYSDTIFTVSNNILWLMMLPKPLLKWLPIETAQQSYQAYKNWGQYMMEMVQAKRAQMSASSEYNQKGTDLFASLVHNAGARTFVEDQSTKSGRIGLDGLSDEELLGNAFVLIVAGYETTAGTLYVSLILLAMYRESQNLLQQDIDRVFRDRSPSEWNYERDFNEAFSGTTGAVLAEVLRWLPSVPSVPKYTTEAQPLTVNGAPCTVPKDTLIALNICAAHRNPSFWPHGKPTHPEMLEHAESNPDDDLGEFRPERWLQDLSEDCSASLDLAGAATTPATLLRPHRGAYLPFSEGSRACLGRRFAQVEIVAVLAVIFQRYSVELAVDEWASDEEVAAMDAEQREDIWEKARSKAQYKFRNCMQSLITNKMTKARVPLRIVKRGEERFGLCKK